MGDEPLVSVCCPTYNHSAFIRDAIEGFLMQRRDFPVEIIIHDDASTDGTAAIVRECAEAHPDLIRPILQTENQYSKGESISPRVFDVSRGKYIAFCEGDDYWTDPLKLQRQVGYLAANPGASGCFHDCVTVDEDSRLRPSHYAGRTYKRSYSQHDCLTNLTSSYGTASLMFRRRVWAEATLPAYIRQAFSDETLDLLITESGSLDYLPFSMSAYRVHGKGLWQGSKPRLRAKLKLRRIAALRQDSSFYRRYPEDIDGLLEGQWRLYWRRSGEGIWRLPLLRAFGLVATVPTPALSRRLTLLLDEEYRALRASARRLRKKCWRDSTEDRDS